MRICAHQPTYLPSLHLLNKISFCDTFILLGHCQFVKQSWHVRNNIRSGKDSMRLTVPIRKTGPIRKGDKFGQNIANTPIDGDHWKRKHLRAIAENYGKRPYFKDYYPEIEAIIQQPHESLAQLNNALLLKFMAWCALAPKVYYSEDYNIEGQKNQMLINLCQEFGANEYVSNPGARSYLDEPLFKKHNIQHFWQEFTHPTYDQGKAFIPNLSVIDLLFNMGPASGELVRNAGHLVASA